MYAHAALTYAGRAEFATEPVLFTALFFKPLAVSPHHVTHLAQFLSTNPHHFSMHLHHHTGQFGIVSQRLQHHRHPSWPHHSSHWTTWHRHRRPARQWSRSRLWIKLLGINEFPRKSEKQTNDNNAKTFFHGTVLHRETYQISVIELLME